MLRNILYSLFVIALANTSFAKAKQPNILWILTDDQRYDSIASFNEMLRGSKESALGYVESPNVDKLAKQGVTFINTFSQSQACAPSRTSMHFGRYAWHTGVYAFEYYNNSTKNYKTSLPENMAELGYQTFHVGKLGVRLKKLMPNGKTAPYKIYQTDISFQKNFSDGLTDWSKGNVKEVNNITLEKPIHCDWLRTPDGKWEYTGKDLADVKGLENQSKEIDQKYDLLRMRNASEKHIWGNGEILGGVSPQPEGETRDGVYTAELIKFLENPNKQLQSGSQNYKGVDPSKPLFVHIGYDFPHTPVLPPKSYRDKFKNIKYKVPTWNKDEVEKLPAQLQKLVRMKNSDHYSDADKQQMIQDYYAFCAYGDDLIGQAVKAFVSYSEKNKQEWLILYVCGDHGWKLNEHGALSKFSPWEVDSRNPIIIVSSDKKKFPANKVVKSFSEFVDIMPTLLNVGGANLANENFSYLDGYDLQKVAKRTLPERDYVIGENSAVTGHRATIRTKDFMFSARSRPAKKFKLGQDFTWAKTTDYSQIEPVLYDLVNDPNELNNLAFNPKYKHIANKMREKLLNIVLGDSRIEVEWGKWGDGTTLYESNFAVDSDDKKLKID